MKNTNPNMFFKKEKSILLRLNKDYLNYSNDFLSDSGSIPIKSHNS